MLAKSHEEDLAAGALAGGPLMSILILSGAVSTCGCFFGTGSGILETNQPPEDIENLHDWVCHHLWNVLETNCNANSRQIEALLKNVLNIQNWENLCDVASYDKAKHLCRMLRPAKIAIDCCWRSFRLSSFSLHINCTNIQSLTQAGTVHCVS